MRPIHALILAVVIATTVSTTLLADAPVLVMPPRVIHVDDSAEPGGNGGVRFPFQNLPEALAEARKLAGAVIIDVAPGTYLIDGTLVIDRPLVLRGSTVLNLDAGGIPQNGTEAGTGTRIVASAALGSEPLIFVGRSDGKVIKGVTIRGFVLKHADVFATEVTIRRVQGFTVYGNIFRAPGRFGLETVASSGRVLGNHFSGIQTGAILTAGYPASPSSVTFKRNRSVGNDLGGLLLSGSSVFIPEKGDELNAVVRDNDLSRNGAFGLRAFIVFRPPGLPADTQARGHVHALFHGNRLHDNVTGILLDAGFPFRLEAPDCDPRRYHGSIDLDLADNDLAGNAQDAWIVFTRWPGPNDPFFKYLHATTYTLTDPDHVFAHALIAHPERDPVIGPCPGDAMDERLNNVLVINGKVMPYETNY